MYSPTHFHLVNPLLHDYLYRAILRGGFSTGKWDTYRCMRYLLRGKMWLPCRGGALKVAGHFIRNCEMKRPEKAGSVVVENTMPDGAWLKNYTMLSEMLTCEKYDDGSKRKTSTITAFVDQGAFKVCLNDRDMEQSLYRSGRSFGEALDALELALIEGKDDDWRSWGKKAKNR